MIKLEHAEKNYTQFHLDCSMEVKEGSITALIGPNGAGKSTTFKMLLGLIRPEGGKIEVLGHPVDALTVKEKSQLGVVMASSGFSGFLNIRDIIPVLEHMYPYFQKEKFIEKCGDFGLPLNKKMQDFSTGMKAKLKVLVAMSHDARLLILDEPTVGLDVLAREEILDMLREYMMPGDRSILISSHISSDLENLCDDFYLIHEGKIIMHEETDRLLTDYGILKVTKEQYGALDKSYLIKKKTENFGYSCLTAQRQFYLENAPELAVEKGNIDEMTAIMIKGEQI